MQKHLNFFPGYSIQMLEMVIILILLQAFCFSAMNIFWFWKKISSTSWTETLHLFRKQSKGTFCLWSMLIHRMTTFWLLSCKVVCDIFIHLNFITLNAYTHYNILDTQMLKLLFPRKFRNIKFINLLSIIINVMDHLISYGKTIIAKNLVKIDKKYCIL